MSRLVDKKLLTESTQSDLLCCHTKHTKHLRHYLHENIGHRGTDLNLLSVYMKTCEEIADAFEEIE
jgi:hypothetical protein